MMPDAFALVNVGGYAGIAQSEWIATGVRDLLLPEVLLVLFACCALAVESERDGRAAPVVALSGAVAAAISLLVSATKFAGAFPLRGLANAVVVDHFSTMVGALALVLLFLTVPALAREAGCPKGPLGGTHALALLATAGALLAATAADLVVALVAVEICSLSAFVLLMRPASPRTLQSAVRGLLAHGVRATAAIVLGMSLLYGVTGSTNLRAMGSRLTAALASPAGLSAKVAIALGCTLVLLGLLAKCGALGGWRYAERTFGIGVAPSLAFAFLRIAAFASIARLLADGIEGTSEPPFGIDVEALCRGLLGATGLLGVAVASVRTLTRARLDRATSYAGVTNVGYALLGLAVDSPFACGAALLLVAANEVAAVGASTAIRVGTPQVGGVPPVAVASCVGALASLPPSAAFLGRGAVLFELFRAGSTIETLLGAFGVVCWAGMLVPSIDLCRRVLVVTHDAPEHGHHRDPVSTVTTVLAVGLSLLTPIAWGPISNHAERAAAAMMRRAPTEPSRPAGPPRHPSATIGISKEVSER